MIENMQKNIIFFSHPKVESMVRKIIKRIFFGQKRNDRKRIFNDILFLNYLTCLECVSMNPTRGWYPGYRTFRDNIQH